MRKSPCTPVAAVSLVFALVASHSVAAWEEDVHYLLTFWLAYQAGFSRGAADEIAKGAQSYDDSAHAGAIGSVGFSTLLGDEGAARSVRDKHFPSDAPIPSPPTRRVVAPNSETARRTIDTAMAAPPGSSEALLKFGEALHPFQDSWSHQGVPDVPFGLRPNYSFAHPEDRGGWWRHDADYTHLHVGEVVDMAARVYQMFGEYLKRYPARRERPAAQWSTLEPIVRQFAAADTKQKKNDWAVKYLNKLFASPALLADRLSLPGQFLPSRAPVTVTIQSPPAVLTKVVPFRRGPSDAPDSLVQAAQEFLGRWLGTQNIAVAASFVDWQRMSMGQFEQFPTLRDDPAAIIEWCEKLLTMQLILDHGVVNNAGHGDPLHPGYRTLPRGPRADGPFSTGLEGKVPVLRASDFVPVSVDGDEGFALILKTSRAAHDSVVLVWREPVGSRWEIIRMAAMAD
jgi:hypothetical protein